jgi:hypothetical protein
MKTFFEVTQRIAKKEKEEKDEEKYKFYIQYFAQYMDTVRDLFEHKFLVFLCNPSDMHWMAIVVVNPSLRYNSVHTLKTENPGETENFCGFCVFDSTAMSDVDMPEAMAKGLIPTLKSKYRAEYGVHLFLNCCASYLYSIDKEETSEGKEVTFSFEQPFGLWNSSDSTKEFPRFDYDFPSILCQHDFNCGFAGIANAFAFVKHLKDVKFYIGERWSLLLGQNGIFPAQPFWKNVVDYAKTHGGFTLTTRSLLSRMREEYYFVLKDLSLLYRADMQAKMNDAIKEEHEKNKNVTINQKKEFTDSIKMTDQEERGQYIVDFIHGMDECNESTPSIGLQEMSYII